MNVRADALSRSNRIINTEWSLQIETLENLGNTRDTRRSVFKEHEQEATSVCITHGGSPSMGNECSDIQREPFIPICISPMGNDRGNIQENRNGPSRDDSNSSKMGHKTMAPTNIGTTNSTINRTGKRQDLLIVILRSLLSKPKNDKSTCVEIIRQSAEEQGFSKSVAGRIANNVRKSTMQIYIGKWNSFCKWIDENNKADPKLASIPNIFNFLIFFLPTIAEFQNYLFEPMELEVSTIQAEWLIWEEGDTFQMINI